MNYNNILTFFFVINCFKLIIEAFNPFMDNDLHAIDWVGPMSTDIVSVHI